MTPFSQTTVAFPGHTDMDRSVKVDWLSLPSIRRDPWWRCDNAGIRHRLEQLGVVFAQVRCLLRPVCVLICSCFPLAQFSRIVGPEFSIIAPSHLQQIRRGQMSAADAADLVNTAWKQGKQSTTAAKLETVALTHSCPYCTLTMEDYEGLVEHLQDCDAMQ